MGGYEATASRFDRWAGSYDSAALQSVLFAPVHGVLLERALRMLSAPRRVLDVGCGTGRLLRATAARLSSPACAGPLLIGLDASAGMLSAARAGPGLHYVRAGAVGLPFATGSFDLVLCTFSYRHWADQDAGLREVARVLAPGGLFALADVFVRTTPQRGGWWRLWQAPPPVRRGVFERAGLRLRGVEQTGGFGRLGEATVMLAAAGTPEGLRNT